MKKRVVLAYSIIIALLALSFISAANDTVSSDPYSSSYTCLKSQIDSRGYSSLTIEELASSLLALGYDGARQSALVSELEKRKSSENCWPSSSCTLRETSLVLLAYNYIGKNVDAIKNWLLNQTMSTKDLTWFLQIETTNKSDCTITYDGSQKKISISEQKIVSGNLGSCLKLAYNGYWLEVANSCYDKDFNISCNSDFLTSTFYKKTSGSTLFLTTATKSAPPNGATTQRIDSLCFKQSGSCNYEGSLWAITAITKKDSSFKNKVLPYLLTLSSETVNTRLMPSAFLYSLTGFDEYFSELTSLQNSKGYWQASSDSAKRYYDTAIGLFGMSIHKDSEQFIAAKDYLLDPSVLGQGCWNSNNIRDTSLLLYTLDGKTAASTNSGDTTRCSDYASQGYSCLSSTECDNVNGSALSNFYCYAGLICCSKSQPSEKTCSEKNGVKCTLGQECSSGNLVSSSDSSLCCIDGTCEEPIIPPTSACESASFRCKALCDSENEDEKYLQCSSSDLKCCSPKRRSEQKSYWWLWLLLILIILVVLAIIFRNQIQMWVFRLKNNFSKKPIAPQQRPPYPMQNQPRQFVPRPMMPPARPINKQPFPKQKELDETLRRLKDMSK
jgi:hypothetical protein